MSFNDGPSTSKDVYSYSQNGTMNTNDTTAQEQTLGQLCCIHILEILKRKLKDIEITLKEIQERINKATDIEVIHCGRKLNGLDCHMFSQNALVDDSDSNSFNCWYNQGTRNMDLLPSEIGTLACNASTPDNAEAACSNLNYDLIPYEPNKPSVSNPDVSYNHNAINNEINIMHEKLIGNKGTELGYLKAPHGFCLGFNDDIVVADTLNHRIQVFDKDGKYIFDFGNPGRCDGFLWLPRKVAVLLNQKFYVVCDQGRSRSRIQLFRENGFFFKKIRITAVDVISGITVAENQNIIFANSVVPTIYVVNHESNACKEIDCKEYIKEPSEITSAGNLIYVCDYKRHSVVVISQQGNLLTTFDTHISMYPNGIDVIKDKCVLVIDSHGNLPHIVVFSITGKLICNYRCHSLQVSRCCGLKIDSAGRLVTVDKNFHHIIMFGNLNLELFST